MQRAAPTAAYVLIITTLLLALAQPAGSTGIPRRGDPNAREATATARSGSIRIDGRLDEPGWLEATIITEFVQSEPVDGAPAEQPTRVRVLFDGEALYVGAMLLERDTSRIARQLVRRDQGGVYDFFDIAIDPDLDRRTGYRFRVSASGVQSDSYLYDDVRDDGNWDAVWESAVQLADSGWSVEMRIPLSQVRYKPSANPQRWGVNFSRRRVAAAERVYFALESRQVHGRVSVFGTLAGLRLPDASRRIEARPYALARTRSAPAQPDDPFFDGRESDWAAGADLRLGIGGSFTLDATINPDFGQVEVDPAVINLSAAENFYGERRPFFVEDARVFDFNLSGGSNSLFYSRRIGRAPQRGMDADAVERPDQTSIQSAMKLTGRTAGGTSVGALLARTARETGRAYFSSGDSIASFLAEPAAWHGVLRVQQDLRAGASQIGGIVALQQRDLPDDGTFDFLSDRSANIGVDFEHAFGSREWALWGFFAGTHVVGDTAAIARLQRGSNHYFQRPDAIGLEFDTSATSMTGAEWRLQLDKRSGRHWTGAVWAAERTPGFDANDLGFSRGSERLDAGARVTYREITPKGWYQNYRLSASTFHNWRHDALEAPLSWSGWQHARKAGSFSLDANATLRNYWSVGANINYDPEKLDDGATRGGPLMVDPREISFNLWGSTDGRAALSAEPRVRYSSGPSGNSFGTSLEVEIRPSSRVELRVEPSFSRSSQVRQFVGVTDDLSYAPTYGPRYLFGALERRSLSMETRLAITVTPSLTFQLFAQPLLSYGRYPGYKALSRAESFAFDALAPGTTPDGGATCAGGAICQAGGTYFVDLTGDGATDYAFGAPDFNVRSLRGNAVLRWEYRPGSTLFVVWQQQRFRSDTVREGFEIGRGASALFETHPENVFIVKMSYWLGG
jgi:hypothetical protein